MPVNDKSVRLLDEKTGKMLLLSRIEGYSYSKVYNVYKKHPEIKTVAEFISNYERMVRERPTKRSVAATKLWDTPYGKLTTLQIHERHDHKDDISPVLLSNRLTKRGGMCPSLWWPKLHGSKFRVRLIKEGIVEANWTNHRPAGYVEDNAVNDPTSHSNRRDQKIDRLKCCLRNKGRERCKHYEKRLAQYTGHPKICNVANKEGCSNYEGVDINVLHDCSGRPAKCYITNGVFI